MPRKKKERATKRADGRYCCRYKNQWFYSPDPEGCLIERERFKQQEKQGLKQFYFVQEYALFWFGQAYPDISPSTKRGLSAHLTKLINAIGNLPVAQVAPSDIKGVYAQYSGMSDSYIKAAKQLYCSLFDSAVADGLIASNPARAKPAKPHRGKTGGHRSITPQEREWINTLCADHRAHPVVMAMLYAGLRPQEAKALVIDRDIDFAKGTVTVRETAHLNGSKYAYTGAGKTAKANRTIPLLPPLERALKGKKGYLISSASGERVNPTTWRVVWRSYVHAMETAINVVDRRWYGRTREHKAIIAAGGSLPEWVSFTVTPYDLRHSFATMCRDQQPPIELHTVIEWMGHSDATMLLRIYDSIDNRTETEAARLKGLTTDPTTKQ
jgi:integrase